MAYVNTFTSLVVSNIAVNTPPKTVPNNRSKPHYIVTAMMSIRRTL